MAGINYSAVSRTIGLQLIRIFRRHIDTQSFNGRRYKPSGRARSLSSMQRYKRKKGIAFNKKLGSTSGRTKGRTMYDTGSLYRSFYVAPYKVNGDVLTVTVSNTAKNRGVPYILFHEDPKNPYIQSNNFRYSIGSQYKERDVMNLSVRELQEVRDLFRRLIRWVK